MPGFSAPSLKERVAHAYYNYGRFCSSHPIMTIVTSILTLLLLSYPVTRLAWTSESAPYDFHVTDNDAWNTYQMKGVESTAMHDLPQWAVNSKPFVYVQQLIVQTHVSNLERETVTSNEKEFGAKNALVTAFDLYEKILEFRYINSLRGSRSVESITDVCFQLHDVPAMFNGKLPKEQCLLLSPAILWPDRQTLFDEKDVWHSVNALECNTPVCTRHLAFGMPNRLSDLKLAQEDPYHEMRYALTLFFNRTQFNPLFVKELIKYLNQSAGIFVEHPSLQSRSEKEPPPKIALAFYKKLRRPYAAYVPLVAGYAALFLYIYYSVTKIDRVKSKCGLAFSAVFTVASSLVMAAGICLHFELTPTLYSGELFPYLAMIVGLENVLCITRSVVNIPVTMDVRSRIAHGLSKEGWSITRNFLSEQFVITIGYLTFVPEIQEFCMFAHIGLVTDFYMQLFFYSPVLTFDLSRFGPHDKEELNRLQLTSSTSKIALDSYPQLDCPFIHALPPRLVGYYGAMFGGSPGFDAGSHGLFRYKSERALTNVASSENETSVTTRICRRRTVSSSASGQETKLFLGTHKQDSKTNNGLLAGHSQSANIQWRFITKTRLIQRFMKIITLVWIIWIAVMVNQLKQLNDMTINLNSVGRNMSEVRSKQPFELPSSVIRISARGQLQTVLEWQKQTVRYWPALFDWYNMSLSGRFVAILPPAFLVVDLEPDKAKVFKSPNRIDLNSQEYSSKLYTTLKGRISLLEIQMNIVLCVSLGIFLSVGGFMCYVCFYGGGQYEADDMKAELGDLESLPAAPRLSPTRTHRRIGSKTIVESVPVVFRGHNTDIEHIALIKNVDRVISSCMEGKLLVWDVRTGDFLFRLQSPAGRGEIENVALSNATTISSPNLQMLHKGSGIDSAVRKRSDAGQKQIHLHPIIQSAQTQESLRVSKIEGIVRNCSRPTIWSMTSFGNFAVVGYSNGHLEVWELETAEMRAEFQCPGSSGIIHLGTRDKRIVAARLSGVLDFLDLCNQSHSSQNKNTLEVILIKSLTAHQHIINSMKFYQSYVITASSDYTLKVFCLTSCSHMYTMYGHNAPVITLVVDERDECAFSSCTQGLICCWDLLEGKVVRTLSETVCLSSSLSLALTANFLVAAGQDGSLYIFNKTTGAFITRIKPKPDDSTYKAVGNGGSVENNEFDLPSMIALEENMVAVGCHGTVQFWDLQYRFLLHEVRLGGGGAGDVKTVLCADGIGVLCSRGNVMHRINLPVIRMKS